MIIQKFKQKENKNKILFMQYSMKYRKNQKNQGVVFNGNSKKKKKIF